MERKIASGLSRAGEPLHANLEFVDGTRGAHASISGISGVATKTSYATFLLYSMSNGGALGADAINSKALVFNVKGEDLLWLDRPNARLDDDARRAYATLGLPAGPFKSVGLFAPARRAAPGSAPMPDTGGRQEGVRPYLWTMRAFARDRLLRFAFADAEDARAQVAFVIARVERVLELAADQGDPNDPGISIGSARVESFSELVDLLDGDALDGMVRSAASGTLDAFRRRLHAAAMHMGQLVRGDASASGREVDWSASQVTVVDIHRLHSLAQMFVVGVILKRALEEKERTGRSKPLLFVVLDELMRPDALWHGDVCHGPTLVVGESRTPVRIHALLGDHARFVVALRVVSTEREQDMLELIVGALRTHGKPDALYLDNGSTYRGDVLRVLCGRLGISLLHARPYDPEARGKMERFWLTMRRQVLDYCGGLATLHDVQVRLLAWLDTHYHRAPHAGLMGKAPVGVYAPDQRDVEPVDDELLRKALIVCHRRRVLVPWSCFFAARRVNPACQ
ncbi:MAG: DDE-type integrase/transposase/recombinase [Polyangiaceae bacterium]